MAACICRFLDKGGVYKLAFGPKAFIVLSDPVVVRHILKVRERTSLPLHCLSMQAAAHTFGNDQSGGPAASSLQLCRCWGRGIKVSVLVTCTRCSQGAAGHCRAGSLGIDSPLPLRQHT